MKHLCHAARCHVEVPPKMLMCLNHWRKVPKYLQKEVWKHYRPGQERTKIVTAEYLQAMQAAIEAVAIKERILLDT